MIDTEIQEFSNLETFFHLLKANVVRLPSAEFFATAEKIESGRIDHLRNAFPTLAFTDPDGMKVYANKDELPKKWQPYVIEHECWETYLWLYSAENAYQRAITDAQKAEIDQVRPFHRIAIFNELKAAHRDGVLGEYNVWVESYYQKLLAKEDGFERKSS